MYPKMIILLGEIFDKLMTFKNITDLHNIVNHIIKKCNIKINVIDNTKNNPIIYKNNKIIFKNKTDKDKKIIIISNHSNYFDSGVLFHLCDTGFVSNDIFDSFEFGKKIVETCKLFILKQKYKQNGYVDKIKEYLKINKLLTIYPEGAISFGNTLMKFRTGAFNACENIWPIVINYGTDFNDGNIHNFLLKIMSLQEITINVTVCDLEIGPFNDEKIESIRKNMAKIGKFELSNVSSRIYNKDFIKQNNTDKSDIKKSDINKSDIKKSSINKSDIKKSDIKKSDIKKSDIKKSDIKKSYIKKSYIKK